MPIIENYDGTFDLRNARSGDIVRLSDGRALHLNVEKVDPNTEKWLSQRDDKDSYHRVVFTTTCARCGATFHFNRGRDNARATLPKTCKKHRGMSAATYDSLVKRGLLEKVEGEKARDAKWPVLYPEDLGRGSFVVFRGLQYVILGSRTHTSARTGLESTLLDLAGQCVCCGKEFACTTPNGSGTPLPLRCTECQERTGSGWRYNPAKDVGSHQYLGVQHSEFVGIADPLACFKAEVQRLRNDVYLKAYGSLREYEESKQERRVGMSPELGAPYGGNK